jgi:hypothetical protein
MPETVKYMVDDLEVEFEYEPGAGTSPVGRNQREIRQVRDAVKPAVAARSEARYKHGENGDERRSNT